MKKAVIIGLVFLIAIANKSYALSDNFREVISIMGIERYNNQGYEINEYIYYTYNHIVYGSPEKAANEPTQRWKDMPNGKWLRNGVKGEYRILGYNNIGKVVNNHDFPMDIVPSTEPTQWTYATLPDAINSWNDISRYKFIEQKQYMQNTNLMRNGDIYDITALDIGLDKSRLDTCSTWKTQGVIYTNRIDKSGKKWEATFVAPPIGSNVSFENSISNSGGAYYMAKYVPSTTIVVNYFAGIQGVNGSEDMKYIKPEHVKRIESSIYINGYLLGTITSTKKLSHSGKAKFTIYHEDLLPGEQYAKLDIRSKIYTEFTTDGPMYASNSCNISVVVVRYLPSNEVDREVLDENDFIEPNNRVPDSKVEINNNFNSNIDIVRIVKDNGENRVVELNKCSSTEKSNSLGFVNAGTLIGIKVNDSANTFLVKMRFKGDKSINTFDNKTQQFEWYEPKKIGNKTMFDNIQQYYDLYNNEITLEKVSDGLFITQYLIPYETKQTLHSWNSIRDMTGSSFNIKKSLLLSRIDKSYVIEFDIYRQVEEETENGINIYTEKENVECNLDVFECWTNLYNRNITPYILNKNKDEIKYEIWKNT